MSESELGGGFHYELPSELIARTPVPARTESRLLLTAAGRGVVGEERFAELKRLLDPGDVLVLNDTKVMPARLEVRRHPSGGRVELLMLRPTSDACWQALAKPARRLRAGDVLEVRAEGDARSETTVEVTAVGTAGQVEVRGVATPLSELMALHGHMPLPPYITAARRQDGVAPDSDLDRSRYQTVYASHDGSVAAPTAGLHFDRDLLDDLAAGGITIAKLTLHVDVGTFRNPDEDDLRDGRLHAETFRYPAAADRLIKAARAGGGRVIAVGTTSLRVLETVARLDLGSLTDAERFWEADAEDPRPVFEGRAHRREGAWEVAGRTSLFLRPPQRIRGADGLITNFHLPHSSLLMLVACALGDGIWRQVYTEAVARRCRFYSYGDAMMIAPLAGRATGGVRT